MLKKGVVFSIWRIAALSDYKNPAIRIVQEVYYSDAAQKGKTTFINCDCVVREGIEVHLAMAPMGTRKIG